MERKCYRNETQPGLYDAIVHCMENLHTFQWKDVHRDQNTSHAV